MTPPRVPGKRTKVPGKPGYEYGTAMPDDRPAQTGLFRWVGKAEEAEFRHVLPWYPKVTRFVVRKDHRGKILDTRYTVVVGGHEDTIWGDELGAPESWLRWPKAVGVYERDIRTCLANIVQNEASTLKQTLASPTWEDGKLLLPPSDLMPPGYSQTHDHDRLGPLATIAETNPKVALLLGFSQAAPYVAPMRALDLSRQSFMVHTTGGPREGKSTSQRAAGCLWGLPTEEGLINTWDNTPAWITGRLGELGCLPIFLDELSSSGYTPSRLKSLLQSALQGGTRGRSTRSGRAKRSAPWHGIMFSTGNDSILGMLTGEPAIRSRVIEIPTPITVDGPTAEKIDRFVVDPDNHGMFRQVPLPEMLAAVKRAEQRLKMPNGGSERTIVQHLSLGVAGAFLLGGASLANSALIAARDVRDQLVAEMAEAGVKPGELLLEAVRQSIMSNPGLFPTRDEYKARLVSDVKPDPKVCGFHEEPTAFIITSKLPGLIAESGITDPLTGLRDLKTRGLLDAEGGKMGLRKRLRVGASLASVYAITLPPEDDSESPTRLDDSGGNTGNTGNIAGQSPAAAELQWEQDEETGNIPGQRPAAASAETGNTVVIHGRFDTPDRIAKEREARTGRPDVPSSQRDVPTPEPVPSVRVGTLAACAACGEPTKSYVDGIPCCATDCDPPKPKAPAPIQDEIPAAEVPADLPELSRVQKRAEQRADFAEQLDHLRRAFAKVGAYPDATELELSAALKTFSASLDGLSFAGPPSRVGQLLFEKLTAQFGSVPVLGAPPNPVVEKPVTMFNFLDQGADVGAHRLVVGTDVNAQYLAAAVGDLGTGDPIRLGSRPDYAKDLKLPGYVQVGADFVVGPRCVVSAGDWIANPMAVYLLQRGGLVVADGWVWPERRRWLNLWVTRLRKARQDLMVRPDLASQMALKAVKAVYAAFLGGYLLSEKYATEELLRPDWAHMIHSLASANALRALDKASIKPFATLVDAAYFLVDDPDDLSGLTFSPQPGKWKRHRIGRTDGETWVTRRSGAVETRTETTLAEQLGKGSLGGVSEAIRHLDETYSRTAVSA